MRGRARNRRLPEPRQKTGVQGKRSACGITRDFNLSRNTVRDIIRTGEDITTQQAATSQARVVCRPAIGAAEGRQQQAGKASPQRADPL